MLLPLLLQLVGPTWAESPWLAPAAPEGWAATEAHFTLHIRPGEPVLVEVDYRLASPDLRAATLRLVGPQLLVTNVSGPVVATGSGLQMALPIDRQTARQQLTGLLVPAYEGGANLEILRATRTHVQVDAPGLDVHIEGAVDGWMEPRSTLDFSWRPQSVGPPAVLAALVQGEAATAFRADANALAIDSVLRWRVLRGSASTFSFDAAGLTELEIEGGNVANFVQSGNTVVVTTKQPVLSLLSVRVRGRVVTGKTERSVPGPQPTGVQRVDRYWVMTKSDEGELVPISSPPSVGAAHLPAWARGIGEGTPLAQWHGNGDVRVYPIDAANIQGPDTVITSARYIVAAAREGRAGLRMTLRVRNERRQFLHVTPPPGWRAIVVRVGNQPVSILDDGRGGLYVPLEKSIETVKGLLSFPVDIEWVGNEAEWGKRGHHTFALPAVDAPIQAAEWEVHLPRGFRGFVPEMRGGEFVLTDLREKDALPEQNDELLYKRQQAEQVESALSNAVSAYKDNDFKTAQMWVDNARGVSDNNEEVEQLQSNLDVLSGKAAPSGSASTDVAQRRVRDLAKAKTGGLVSKQVEIEEKALDAYRSGDLDKAEGLYEQAYELANELQRTEQAESTVQTSKISIASSTLEVIRKEKGKKSDMDRGFGGGDSGGEAKVVDSWNGETTGWFGALEPNDSVGDEFELAPSADDGAVGQVLGGALGGQGSGAGGLGIDSGAYAVEGLNLDPADVSGDGFGLVGTGEGGGGYGYGAGMAGSRGDDQQVANGYDESPPEPAPAEPQVYAGDAGIHDEERSKSAVVVSKDYLEMVPSGRSYQSIVSTVPGSNKNAKEAPANRESRKGEELSEEDGEEMVAQSVTISVGGRGGSTKKSASPPVFGMAKQEDKPMDEPVQKPAPSKPAAGPARPVAAAAPQLSTTSTRSSGRAAAPMAESAPPPALAPPPPPMPPAATTAPQHAAALGYFEDDGRDLITAAVVIRSEKISIIEDVPSAADVTMDEQQAHFMPADASIRTENAPATASAELDAAEFDWRGPAQGKRRVPLERRRALEASPSPMAFAMPLDGPAVAHSHALLPADQAPTFTVRYKELPTENL